MSELHSPESRTKRFLDKTGTTELLADRQRFKEWASKVTPEEFEKMLLRLNAFVSTQKPPKPIRRYNEIVSAVGAPGHLEYIAPTREDRKELLKTLCGSLQRLIMSDRYEDAGLLAYYAIQMIHPFHEGNGRTSRLMYMLLAVSTPETLEDTIRIAIGSHPDPEVNQLFGRPGRITFALRFRTFPEIYRELNRIVATNILGREFISQYKGIQFVGMDGIKPSLLQSRFTPYTAARLYLAIMEKMGSTRLAYSPIMQPRDIAFVAFITSKGKLEQYKSTWRSKLYGLTAKSQTGQKGDVYAYNGKSVISDMSEEDASNVAGAFEKIKRIVVEHLIQSIEFPDQYPHPQDPNKTLREFYESQSQQ